MADELQNIAILNVKGVNYDVNYVFYGIQPNMIQLIG